eukprot:1853666-Lingulodinium_polyedra.AAC.1
MGLGLADLLHFARRSRQTSYSSSADRHMTHPCRGALRDVTSSAEGSSVTAGKVYSHPVL